MPEIEEEVIENEEETVEDEQEEQEEEQEEEGEEQEQVEEEDDEEETIITFGDEEPPKREEDEHEDAPGWVKKVRKVNRKLESEVKRLKRELEKRSTEQTSEAKEIEVGEMPTLKSVGYDDKKYQAAIAEWTERKIKAEERRLEKAKAEEEQQKRWQEKQTRYATQKAAHGFKDFDEAEQLVADTLDVTQQGIIVHAAKDSALLTYALGTRPDKLEAISAIKDPVEFAVAIGELQKDLKVGKRKPPAPERRVTGKSGGATGTTEAQLEKAREKAAQTGDYTEVIRLKKKLKAKSST